MKQHTLQSIWEYNRAPDEAVQSSHHPVRDYASISPIFAAFANPFSHIIKIREYLAGITTAGVAVVTTICPCCGSQIFDCPPVFYVHVTPYNHE